MPSTIEPLNERGSKRIHVALPIRVTYWDKANHPCLAYACTYDISDRGARIGGLRCVKETGEIIAVERGRNKVFCRVVWIGQTNSELQGLVGIECVEHGRTFWDAELRDMEEIYEPIVIEARQVPLNIPAVGVTRNRRRYERFDVKGMAEFLRSGPSGQRVEGTLSNLSQVGCLLTTKEILVPGVELRVLLKVGNYDLSLKGLVRHVNGKAGSGVEFSEIRKGDRQVLHFLLHKLAEKELESLFEFELRH